jgi:heme/copper-type cytochrome/quinol oxidase subunit 1
MRESVFRKMPQQYLVAGTLFLILGVWVRHLVQVHGGFSAAADFLQASHGTLMVFFGIIPIFFVAVGYGLVPSVRTAWPFVDRLTLVLFYVSAGIVVIALGRYNLAFFVFALGLNLLFGIAAAIGFMTRSLLPQDRPGKRRMHATAVAFLGLSVWIIVTYALLEFAAIRQLAVMWLTGSSAVTYEAAANDSSVPLIWKDLFWFLGHPEVLVFFTLICGLIVDGLRNLFWRRAAV